MVVVTKVWSCDVTIMASLDSWAALLNVSQIPTHGRFLVNLSLLYDMLQLFDSNGLFSKVTTPQPADNLD